MNNPTHSPGDRQPRAHCGKKRRATPGPHRTAPATGTKKQKHAAKSVDLREQLVNGCEVGPADHISVPEEMITSLHGIVLDVDPAPLNPRRVTKKTRATPALLYRRFYSRMLQRHPVLYKAEVRSSGTGLHIIIRFDKPIVFETDGDHKRWAAIVKIIQRLIPTDPNAPGITAFTRPIGSINGKNNHVVKLLKKGQPVTAEEVLALAQQVRTAPFRTIMSILLGGDKATPCPVCRTEDSSLAALDKTGKCYKCGTVGLGRLFDIFLKAKPE